MNRFKFLVIIVVCFALIGCTQQFHLTLVSSQGEATVGTESTAERKSAIAPSTPVAVTQGTATVSGESAAKLSDSD